jgi:DinB family protein
MVDLHSEVGANHEAVDEFLSAARAVVPGSFAKPRAEGKWSPAQIAEHLAKSYEMSLEMLTGRYAGPRPPFLVRPFVRFFLLRPVLQKGAFARPFQSPSPLRASQDPGLPDVVLPRLERASRAVEQAVLAEQAAGRTRVDHAFFGRIPIADHLRFQVIHTRHHRRQLP